MVKGIVPEGKLDGFAPTPWSEESEPWQTIDARLPADHLARRIARAVETLNLENLLVSYLGVGKKALRPDLLLKLVLYEMQSNRPSPAQWARDVRENEAVRWLLLGMQPSRSRLYEFRDRIARFLPAWHTQALGSAREERMTQAKRAALDSSTVAACAARRQLRNEERLEKRTQIIDQALQQLSSSSPSWLGRTMRGLRRQKRHCQRAAEVLQRRLAENAKRRACDRKPAHRVLISLSDPESVLARDKLNVFRPLYSVQLLRDLDSPLVFAYDVLAQNNDNGVMEPMLDRMLHSVGRKPEQLLADSGYISLQHLELCEQAGIRLYGPCQENDFSQQNGKKPQSNQHAQLPKSAFQWLPEERTFRCPEGHLLGWTKRIKQDRADSTIMLDIYTCPAEHCLRCPRQTTCTRNPRKGRSVSRMQNEELLDALRARMQTEEAKQLYRHRSRTVELNYADLKEHRGLRHFHGRGLLRAAAEIGLLLLAHNLLSIDSYREQHRAPSINNDTPQNLQAA